MHSSSISRVFSAFVVILWAQGGTSLQAQSKDDSAAEAKTAKRLPIPGSEARKKADSAFREVFGTEVATAKTPAQRIALCEKLLRLAEEETDPTERYSLLNNARLVAVSSGDSRTALRVVAKMMDGYALDSFRARLATLQALSKTAATHGQFGQLAQATADLAEESVTADAMDGVEELLTRASEAARASGDAKLVNALNARTKELHMAKRLYDETRPFREKLLKAPDDPEANAVLGKYHCFVRRDWETGLPMLAKGNDETLRAAARKDLAAPDSSGKKVEVADAWWELGDGMADNADALRARARRWYRQALADLSGLTKARVEKRLSEGGGAAEAKPEGRPSRPAPATGRRDDQRALLDYVAQAVKDKKTSKSKELGFTLGNKAFAIAPDDGEILVGLDISIGNFNKISGIRPIFLTGKGQVVGQVIGQASAKGARLLAKKGYAIGQVRVKGGIGIDGIGVVFMKIDEDGLNSEQKYSSDWYGNAAGGGEALGDEGNTVVGIFGHKNDRELSALGVVTVPRRK